LFVERENAMIERKDNNRRRDNNQKKNASEYNSEHSLNVLAETCLRRLFDEEFS
jgi:hypothetical protein